jgi:hypothetical protein
VVIDSQDTIYVAAPFGFSTTTSFVWRSTDHGKTFHLVPGNLPAEGKPAVTCPGGGDSALAVDTHQPVNRLYFADLQGLTEVSSSVSSDRGATWLSTCSAAHATAVDRPWIATFGDPGNGGALYQTVDQANQCVVSCLEEPNQVGSNVVEITRSQDGVTFFPPVGQQIEPDGIVSGIVTDRNSGDVYIAHTALIGLDGKLGGSDSHGNDNALVVVRFPGGYSGTPIALGAGQTLCQTRPDVCTTEVAYKASVTTSGDSTVTVNQDFAPIAIDTAGNLYLVWSEAPVDASGKNAGSSQIYLTVSTDHGSHWGPRVRVTAATPNLATNVFPWVTAGDPGRLDIVWYGTPVLGSCPNQPCGPGAIQGSWFAMMAQSLNAVTSTGQPNASPSFTTTHVSEISNHFGAICTMGIGCTTGGDRGLIDFLSVTTGLHGEANVVWTDSINRNFVGGTSAGLIGFNRQVSGPSLYTNFGQVNGATPLTQCAAGSPDAFYSAGGLTVPATDNLIVQKACVAMADAQHYRIQVVVKDLTSLATALGGTDAVWLVRWEVPSQAPSSANQGHVYFAAMDANSGGTPTFFDGETSSIDTTKAKFLTYPPAHTIPGTVIRSSPGIITMTVPVSDVGGDPQATLYSVTGLSVTQALPSSTPPNGQVFNQIDATAPFDFLPSASQPPSCHEGDGQGDIQDGNGGQAHFTVDGDQCEDGDAQSVQEQDPARGADFKSSQVNSVTFDDIANTMVMAGSGTNAGRAVTFTVVAVDNGPTLPGLFTLSLSDGYSVSGTLISGSIQLH